MNLISSEGYFFICAFCFDVRSDKLIIKVFVSVIKTKYSYNGEEGTIAIIGPKRMEYERVVNLLNYIKENIEEKNN